ncbi:MAG: hypothetical protein HY681_09760 [Chloroflexi bacterium]|nr:hypothetical protein [Chloroflexota bacterium]
MPSELATQAIGILSPVFGEFMAKAKVTAACSLAGLDVESLTKLQKAQFAEKLRLTCVRALGERATNEIITKVMNL